MNVTDVTKNNDGTIDVVHRVGPTTQVIETIEDKDGYTYQLLKESIAVRKGERKLTDWKFMLKYQMFNVKYDEPVITVTFNSTKQVTFTGYSDSEIYDLFTRYLTPDAILFD